MKLRKLTRREVIISLSVFAFCFVIILFVKQYQSSPKQDAVNSNNRSGINLSDDKKDTTFIPKFWKYHSGDDSLWRGKNFNDSKWDSVMPELNLTQISEGYFKGNCWFRANIVVDQNVEVQTLTGTIKTFLPIGKVICMILFASFSATGNSGLAMSLRRIIFANSPPNTDL